MPPKANIGNQHFFCPLPSPRRAPWTRLGPNLRWIRYLSGFRASRDGLESCGTDQGHGRRMRAPRDESESCGTDQGPTERMRISHHLPPPPIDLEKITPMSVLLDLSNDRRSVPFQLSGAHRTIRVRSVASSTSTRAP